MWRQANCLLHHQKLNNLNLWILSKLHTLNTENGNGFLLKKVQSVDSIPGIQSILETNRKTNFKIIEFQFTKSLRIVK